MNLAPILGFLIAIGVFIGGLLSSTSNWKIYLNTHAFFIVVGGTLAATFVSFSFGHLFKVAKVFVGKVLGRNSMPHIKVIEEIVELSQGLQQNENYLQEYSTSIKNSFLKEAVELHNEGGVHIDELESILVKRSEVHFVRYEEESQVFKTIARFPPAFGLLGAVSGMIALMAGLGSPDSFKQIGPAMAIAMVATLYGIALANFVFVPLGESLAKWNKEDHLMRNIVIDGIKLLNKKQHPLIVEEFLKSYLLSSERKLLKSPRAS
jgi:chemotaxis protein MotA